MKDFLFLVLFLVTVSLTTQAAAVRSEVTCPHNILETCRWDIQSHAAHVDGKLTVQVTWEKSILSRHMDKPLAAALQCNVDRDFNFAGGGYLKVWFKGDSQPCDAGRGNPAVCGVTFIFDKEAPKPGRFPLGFTVVAPAGKELAKLENFNTLNLQCGDFSRADYGRYQWNSRIGWQAGGLGDGTFSENSPATLAAP